MTNISTQIKGGKISRPAVLPPSSLLSSMLKQDESVYRTDSDSNSQSCLEKAFQDSHALLTVPGKPWVETEKSSVGIKEESAAQEMMDSLHQIIRDSSMCGNLDDLNIDQEELKEWENALLRINTMTSIELPVELNDIMANDIFSYVEDVLLKECSTDMNEQLPECLSELQLQGDLNELLGISDSLETGSPGQGIMKLAHISPELEQANPVEPFVELCESMIFDTSPPGQQNQSRLTAASHRSQAEIGLPGQNHIHSGTLGYPKNVLLPNLQNQAQHVSFHNHNPVPFNQSVQPSSQWTGPQMSGSKNISLPQDILLNPSPSACLQGQFPLSTQSVDNQRRAGWPQSQPSVQNSTLHSVVPKVPTVQNIPDGHRQVQSYPLARLMQQPHAQPEVIGNTVYGQQGEHVVHPSNSVFGQQTTNAVYAQQRELLHPVNAVFGEQGKPMEVANAVYSQQGELLNSGNLAPISSCMFERTPVTSLCFSPGQDMVFSKTTEFLPQNPVQGSYIFQNSSAECILNNGLTPDSACHLQQQFLTCNSQTQVT